MASKMQRRYEPRTPEEKLGYLVEECGEVLAAAGKSLRWGLESSNPELPPEERELNMYWLLRELSDLERAIGYVRGMIPVRCNHGDILGGARCLLPVRHPGEHVPGKRGTNGQ